MTLDHITELNKQLEQQVVVDQLDARRIKLTEPPAEPVPVFTLAGQRISTSGNLTVLAAQAKHGKSAVVGAMLASLFAHPEDGADVFGFEATPHNGKAVVLLDTEQSPYDAWLLVSRAMRRTGLTEQPGNLRAYALLDVSVEDRLQMLRAELERAQAECGGVHAVFIDGVGDLCKSVNDEAEVIHLVSELVALAVRYDCPLVLVLHENPAAPGFAGKTRGHLGSQLERKAESNLRIKKDADGVSVIFSEKLRAGLIPENKGPCFRYDAAAGMHISCESPAVEKQQQARESQREEVREIFDTEKAVGGLRWSELRQRIAELHPGSTSNAQEKRIERLQKAGVIKKNSNDRWFPSK